MSLGVLSIVVLAIAIILAVIVNIKMFGRMSDPDRKSGSRFYDQKLHKRLEDKPRDSLGPLSIVTVLAFGLFWFLSANGY